MSKPQSGGGGRRRSKRRPKPDERLTVVRMRPSREFPISEVLHASGSVRDSRLQSIRVVGGNTKSMRVFLRGAFVNNEIVSLAVIQSTPGRLNRTLTMPRRVKNAFLDCTAELPEDESFIALTDIATGDVSENVDYVDFTFLRESPPVLAIGQHHQVTTRTTTNTIANDIFLDVTPADMPPTGSFCSSLLEGINYILVSRWDSNLSRNRLRFTSPEKYIGDPFNSGTQVVLNAQ